MKRLVAALCLVAVFGFGTAGASAAPPPSILLDGLPLPFPVPPALMEGRTMVPFRAIAEALGIRVTWLPESQSIDARGFGKQVLLTVNRREVLVDGAGRSLDVPPVIVNERTLVPLRFFSEVFGAVAGWDEESRTVSIRSPIRTMRTMVFYAIRSYPERELVGHFSDVAYGWAVLRPDGSLDTAGDADYHWPEPDGNITGEWLMLEAELAGAGRHLMVHALDSKGEFTALVRDPALVERAAESIAALVRAKGFGGVVLDLEYLGQTEQGEELARVRQGLVDLVRAVSSRLRPLGRETTVSVHPPNGAFHGYDYKALAEAADHLQLMAHDYLDRRTETGPEPADLVIQAIEETLAEMPRERLLLGLVAPYETPESLAQKAGLAKRYNLAGLTVWRLGSIGAERMDALEGEVLPLKS